MQEAEKRILKVVAASLFLILVLLYLAFYSLLDALLVYANVIAMSLCGIWSLILTGLNFNISNCAKIVVRQSFFPECRSLTTSVTRNEWLTHHLVFPLRLATFALRELREVRAVSCLLVRGNILNSIVPSQ